jgi:hypothetical protein
MALAPDPRDPMKKTAAAPTTSGKTITYKIAKGSKPAAAPTATGAAGGSGGNLADIASARAASETNATIAGLKALQDYANQQGLLRATQQGQLGLAASKYLEGLHLPERTTADYAAAADAQRAAASGYSGGLQQTVSDAAAQVQQNLQATGSPQTAYNQSEAAGNALYALGGTLPATQFGVTGPTVAASLRALPAQALGYGQQLALGQLGAGQQEAAKFNADITGALAKQGTLASSYLDDLLSAQAKTNEAAALAAYRNATLTQRGQIANQSAGLKQQQIDSLNAWRSTQAKISTFTAQSLADHRAAQDTNDTARLNETAQHHTALENLSAQNAANLEAYRNNQIDLGTFNANTSRINSQTSRINAQTSRIRANKPSTSAPTSKFIGNRLFQWDAAASKWVPAPGAPLKPVKPTRAKTLPVSVVNTATKMAETGFANRLVVDENGRITPTAGAGGNSILGALGGGTTAAPKTYGQTLTSIAKYLNIHGVVPMSAARRQARTIMESVGYVPVTVAGPSGHHD